MKKNTIILILLLTILGQTSFAQDVEEKLYPNPKKALIYSAILPGAGQFYNKKYWKIPIIYGLGGFLVYNYVNFNAEYRCYLGALNDDEHCSGFNTQLLAESQIRDRKDIAKRNRDLQVILLLLTYVVNITDANVDAHLHEFDIGDNASARIDPMVKPFQTNNGGINNAIGLNIDIKF